MKHLIAGVLGVALMGAVLSANAHQEEQGKQARASETQHQMTRMHEHMGKTENLMDEIRNSKQPEKRREMMHEHMNHMRTGMDMMHDDEMMHDGHMMHGKHMMDGKKSDGEPCPYMDGHVEMMEKRMEMMQRMMRQMMEHQSMQDMPMHR